VKHTVIEGQQMQKQVVGQPLILSVIYLAVLYLLASYIQD
jgi:hypothetical protein